MFDLRRREFITLLGGAAAWPLAARSSKPERSPGSACFGTPVVPRKKPFFLKPLVEGIAKLGYVEGQNVIFEHRFPAEQPERFKAMAAELARLDLDVVIASGPAAS
jgi:putative ABC transport system substrate-binding protein